MSELMQTLLEAMIPMLLTGIGGACGWLLKSHRREEARDQAMEAGLRTLLRAELLEIHTRHVAHHEPISVSIQDEADRVYRAYHRLGGNGTGTMMHEQIMALMAYVDQGGGDEDAS
ncbi:MAG: hypothetical protein ACRC44_08615 [Bifidobacterium asteroides]